MSLLQKARAAASVAGAGIDLWVDPPRVAGLKVTLDREWEQRRAAQREEFQKNNPEFAERQRKEAEDYRRRGLLREPRKLSNYHLRLHDEATGREWEARLSIDTERERVDWSYTSNGLFGNGHWGSGGLGLLFVTLPVAALLSPYIFVRGRLHAAEEERRGMSRHGIALLDALGDQLTFDEKRELTIAFKNEWTHEWLMRQKIGFERAKEFLKAMPLTEERMSAKEAAAYGEEEATSLHWFGEQGDCLAHGSFYGQRDHYVEVLATRFEGKEADVLAACYSSRRLIVDGEEKTE